MKESIYIFTNSKSILDCVKESLEPIPSLRVQGLNTLDKDIDFMNEIPPDIVLLGEDLGLDEITRIKREIDKNKKLENIPVVYSANDPDSSKIDLLFKKGLVDDCLLLRYSLAEKEFKIAKLLELKKLREEAEKLRIESLYLQSELAAYERRKFYFEKKKNQVNKETLVNMMYKIRTFLTGIKGGLEVLFKNDIQGKDRENIIALVKRNIEELEKFVNSEDLTVKEEKKHRELKVAEFKSIFNEILKRAQFEARKRSISLFLELPERDFSVLSDAVELEFGLESILKGIINSARNGSIIKGEVKPQTTGNFLEFSFSMRKDSISRSALEKYVDYHPEILEFLLSQKTKLEIFESEENLNIRFYLLRLS